MKLNVFPKEAGGVGLLEDSGVMKHGNTDDRFDSDCGVDVEILYI